MKVEAAIKHLHISDDVPPATKDFAFGGLAGTGQTPHVETGTNSTCDVIKIPRDGTAREVLERTNRTWRFEVPMSN